jgi:xylulokinase
MTWLDSRGKRQAERITVETGEHVSAKHVAAKALWLKENETEAFKKADKFVDCGAFLITKMTGNFAWGFWNASWFGYDEQTRSWKFEDYGLAGDKLPMPIPTTGQAGETTNPAARQMGVRRGIPVIAGGSDVVAAYVGSGAIRPGSAHVYLGSSSWICLSSNSPVTPDESADFIIGRPFQHWVNIGESESACSCIDWLGQQLGILSATPSETEYLTMQKMAHEVSPGSGRLIFLPWMKGERAPIKDNNARGAFIGLTLSHTRQHMVRSIMEGVAYNNRWTLEKLESLAAVRISSLRAIGGGFRSRVWAQILADVMRKSVKVLEHPQYAGGVGAALIAALGVRAYKDIKELQDLTPVSFDFRPRESVSRIYDKLFTDFKQSYLKPLSDVYSCWGPA